MPGPIPLRSDERTGHAHGAGGQSAGITSGTLQPVKWPQVKKEWTDTAKELYRGKKASGDAEYMQQSDIARLRFLCDNVTFYERQGIRSAMMLANLQSEMSNLMFSEGDRRRARIELSKVDTSKEDAQVVALRGYKDMLGGPATK
ncbi:phage terminase small subunit [Brevibacterium moorei]|uniref:phage terminase small subunit n=1 Tax=Brevibacterium moorei TaxID=2968457 RepID=UPI00211B9C70|nr:hypothetical protein [Brevibacterium sp. 68QC2CO]MCQ9385127.1 hypothetical protein [Brevibacterium sp. 68QC2CO]